MEQNEISQRLQAAEILRRLALGKDPSSGATLDDPNILNRPEVIRALVIGAETSRASTTLPSTAQRPERLGSSWSKDEDAELLEMFDRRMPIEAMARELKRNDGGVQSRLVKLGVARDKAEVGRILKRPTS